jgi:cyclophilin family peptidyl-prolyl cis-trans isomerase
MIAASKLTKDSRASDNKLTEFVRKNADSLRVIVRSDAPIEIPASFCEEIVSISDIVYSTMKNIAIVAGFLILLVGVVYWMTVNYNGQSQTFLEEPQAITQPAGAQAEVQQVATQDDMKKPKLTINKAKKYTALMKTSAGDMEIMLYADKTPITVNNFVTLSKKDFYKNVIFHRTIKGFMIQGGDPTGTGSGGPGYKFEDEAFDGEYTRGTLAMANAGPNTNGSQFFIMHKDNALPKNYVIFGKVTKGLDVVDKIAEAPTNAGGEGSTPVNPVKIESVTITEK